MGSQCCCEHDCVIFATNWSPCEAGPWSPSTEDWDQITGTWTVTDPGDCYEQYLSADSAGAKIICLHPAWSGQHWVDCTILEVAGSRPRILVGANVTGTSYYYVEVDIDAGFLRFGDQSGEIDHWSYGDMGIADPLSVWLSMANEGRATLSAGWYNDCRQKGYHVCVPETNNSYCGLMDGPDGTARARFGTVPDIFVFSNHTDTPGVPYPCGACGCRCNGDCVPRRLYWRLALNVAESDECCKFAVPIWGQMEFDITDETRCTWNLNLDLGCGYTLGGMFVAPVDENITEGCDAWLIHDAGGWPGVLFGTETYFYCTCVPFYFRWDYVTAHYPGDAICVWMLEIADEPFTE